MKNLENYPYRCTFSFISESNQIFLSGQRIDVYTYSNLYHSEQSNFKYSV